MTTEMNEAELHVLPTDDTEEQEQVPDLSLAPAFPICEDSPSRAEIEAWKEEHIAVFAMPLGSEEDIFVFRSVTRAEWMNLRLTLSQRAQNGENVDEEDLMRGIVDSCVLWATGPVIQATEIKAGTIETMYEVIRIHSNFLNPAAAASMVIRL